MTDYVGTVVTALTSNWTPANTGGRTPTVKKIIELTDFNLSNGDFIGVYAGDETEQPRFVGYKGVHPSYMVSFTVSTAASHAQLILMREELRRIVHALRKTVATGALWHWQRAIDVSDKRRGTFKYVCDTLIDVPVEVLS